MEPTDIHIGVRDPNLSLVGKVRTEDMDIKSVIKHCGYGNWTLRLPRELAMAEALQTAGYGIQVLHRHPRTETWETLFSGPVQSPSYKRTADDPDGIVTVSGVTDEIILADALAWGDPGSLIDAQSRSNDVRTGPAESLIKQYVTHNIGPGALPSRRSGLASKLVIDTDNGTGPEVQKSPRFQNLLELITEIAVYSNMGFKVVQEGNSLVFKTYHINDRSAFVRFDIQNGSLTEETTAISAPAVTRTIVAGQGEGIERTLIPRTTADAQAAEASWGRIIERWIDQRNTDDPEELQQAGDEPLIDGGFTGVSVKAVPTDHINMSFGADWGLGDIVSVNVNGNEAQSIITEMAMVANSAGVDIGAALGDVSGFKAGTSLQSQMDSNSKRLSALERNIGEARKDVYGNTLLAGLVTEGDIESEKIRLRATNDLSLVSTSHPFQVGPDNGENIGMDGNEIMSRNNGNVSDLHLQLEGGRVTMFQNEPGLVGNQLYVRSTAARTSPDPGAIVIGDLATTAIHLDDNNIEARNGTNPASLYINPRGGDVYFGGPLKGYSGGSPLIVADKMEVQRIEITDPGDVPNHSSLGVGLRIGQHNGNNLQVDNNEIASYNNGSVDSLLINPEGGTIYLGAAVGSNANGIRIAPIYDSTSGNSSNVYVHTSGYLYRSTSALKYKINIEDGPQSWAEVWEALRPVTYHDRTAAEKYSDWLDTPEDERDPEDLNIITGLEKHAGFIADEVVEAGGEIFVTRGEDGEVEGLKYERLLAAAHAHSMKLQTKIEELEQRLDQLTEQVNNS